MEGAELSRLAGTTLIEILAGLTIGTIFGTGSDLLMMISRGTKH